MNLRSLATNLNNRLLSRAGIHVQRGRRSPLIVRSNALRRLDVSAVLDVGAHEGGFGKEIRAGGFLGQIFSFEPNPAVLPRLKGLAGADGRWTITEIALSDSVGRVPFHVSGNEVSSSILVMTDLHLESAPKSAVVSTIEVATSPLDDLVEGLGLLPTDRVLFKIDVQGAERQVLDGAVGFLADPRCIALDLEMSFGGVYEDQADYLDLLVWLRELGFEVWDILPGICGPQDELLQADVILTKRDSW